METIDRQAIRILSEKYKRNQELSFLYSFFLIFFKRVCPGGKDSERNINQSEMFNFLESNLHELNQIKYCTLKIIHEIEIYFSNDNYEDKHICENCIYVLKKGLQKIQQRINTGKEQQMKNELQESTTRWCKIPTPGEEDISSLFD